MLHLVEYPKSFLSHVASQPLNAFNVGVTILTLSLSIQLVNSNGLIKDEQKKNEKLSKYVARLEDRLKELDIVVLTEDELEKAAEAEALRQVELALQEKAKAAPKTKSVMV
ncbi:hypothetical protein DYB37_005038 [Aphanomyces astaci]|uniref:Uncharacterized protein n=1 Tax=Aphanomyces astaci TaxID=112090 RepID=A0A397CK69_APHAT|nr:hypothetical protein DYB36_001667 [Aphanomyces astaci]RHY16691.1 hypothetical protein DYB25_008757 [Aphanomyces astaci]RHY45363.1 hypothetical protein DYB38_003945 [Aphanomyces astaci]RHY60200.1 hypothetical protein DYB34_002352 [Aphanomyces astaci]RHY64178.1 hypothetical protein DYB30_000335 [Aphanomyces astaci]